MHIEAGLIYHIYNQGNNRQKIFYQGRNYEYFLRKMVKYLYPYADILCYCLMPNHFHWLLYINTLELRIKKDKVRTINNSIGILLRSYARAINNQEGQTGSLFREDTKAKNGILEGVITLEGPNAHQFFKHGNEYALQCFRYIHQNPVKAGLVANPEDWPWSSASEYASPDNSKNGICSVKLGKKLLLGI
ncbi:MAG: transposase [Saprospirales bacterium]|nr:transposase [Saprospirales bacterium]MBK8490582.1 transposase [Saprospirales bacterium]